MTSGPSPQIMLLIVIYACILTSTTATRCNVTAALSDHPGLDMANTCPEELDQGSTCAVECATGFRAVGQFYCFRTVLLGTSRCLPQSEETTTLTRIVGFFQVVAKRRRTPGLGAAFRASVRKALSESLVLNPADFEQLEVSLISPAGVFFPNASVIEVSYEVIVKEADWVDQVTTDLRKIGEGDQIVHQEFVRIMGAEGYPVVGIEVLTPPHGFVDELPIVEEPAQPKQTGLSAKAISGIVLASCCSACCCSCAGFLMVLCLYRGERDELTKQRCDGPFGLPPQSPLPLMPSPSSPRLPQGEITAEVGGGQELRASEFV
mmetsp:Transcript_108537/g.305933  ORF Transcript_108537/g.305933 Transcript_108537/m.305933 type:complete len:320 (+) Transcript_108537:103-1062(+)